MLASAKGRGMTRIGQHGLSRKFGHSRSMKLSNHPSTLERVLNVLRGGAAQQVSQYHDKISRRQLSVPGHQVGGFERILGLRVGSQLRQRVCQILRAGVRERHIAPARENVGPGSLWRMRMLKCRRERRPADPGAVLRLVAIRHEDRSLRRRAGEGRTRNDGLGRVELSRGSLWVGRRR